MIPLPNGTPTGENVVLIGVLKFGTSFCRGPVGNRPKIVRTKNFRDSPGTSPDWWFNQKSWSNSPVEGKVVFLCFSHYLEGTVVGFGISEASTVSQHLTAFGMRLRHQIQSMTDIPQTRWGPRVGKRRKMRQTPLDLPKTYGKMKGLKFWKALNIWPHNS